MPQPKSLDQFFTKPHIASLCWKSLCPVLQKLTGKKAGALFFVEPSAGDGAFYNLLPKGDAHRIGVDIAPRSSQFIRHDFLTWNLPPLDYCKSDIVVVGNPPFGKRGALAVKFFEKAATIADTIAFIVPVIFRKFFIHKQLSPDFRWVYAVDLPRMAFRTDKKVDYGVNTEFQVWTRLPGAHQNKRLFSPPPLKHADFEMWQYNNTAQALKVFANDFDFAVPCQGWQDYTRRESDANKCEKTKQWMLFKAGEKAVHERLHDGMDFGVLALKNTTSIPGFRKGDVVQEYLHLYE